MSGYKIIIMLLMTIGISIVNSPSQSFQTNIPDKEKNYELVYASLSAQVNKERIRDGVYYLAQDPLPRRVLNWSLPGHVLSSLE
jgi:hypothetical protein